ncbi:MAG: outer membrane lipoprotein-sorting protein [Candidatus Dormiibacterota bacterium]
MRWHKTISALIVGLLLLSLGHITHASDDRLTRETVERVARLFSGKSSIATLQMQIFGENGQRDLTMKIWTQGDDALVRIISPQKDAGTAILKIGSDVWYYLPKVNRTIKAPSSMTMTSWMGSDFTLDDLVKESGLVRDYSLANSFEGKRGEVAVYEYTMTPRPGAAVVWGKIVLQVRQANLMPAWQGFYDEDGKLDRDLTFSDYKTIGGRLMPTRLVMRSLDKPGQQSTIVYEDIAFDVPIGAETFSLPNLKR